MGAMLSSYARFVNMSLRVAQRLPAARRLVGWFLRRACIYSAYKRLRTPQCHQPQFAQPNKRFRQAMPRNAQMTLQGQSLGEENETSFIWQTSLIGQLTKPCDAECGRVQGGGRKSAAWCERCTREALPLRQPVYNRFHWCCR